MSAVLLDDIFEARRTLQGKVLRTPLVPSPTLSAQCGQPVYLKLESQQLTGSFKLRGATNAIAQLSAADKTRGVVAASTGNHGRALAYAASAVGVRAVICMSELVPANKVEAIRALGAEIRIVGRSQDDAQLEAERLVREDGLAMVPPFDYGPVIAGQGTIALEILEDLPEVDTVLVPLSGGGLFSGIARAIKSASPAIAMIGVTMERGCAMHASLAAGRPVQVEELPTLADSLGGGIGLDNQYTFAMTRELADDTVLVAEDDIACAIGHAYWQEGQVVEGAAAVGIAALLTGRVRPRGPAVVVVSGRNIDMAAHHRIVGDARPQ